MAEKLERLRRQLVNAKNLRRQADADLYSALIAINEELINAGHPPDFDTTDIRLTPNGVYESPLRSRRLSDLLTQGTFPSIREKCVSHYTRLETFRSIAATRELRLYSVRKRITEDELQRMLEELGFVGHSDVDPISGRPIFEQLSDHLFYTSFSEDQNSDYLWRTFGDDHRGVRLDFHIQAHVEDFRSISYASVKTSPLGSLIQRIRREVGRTLLLRGVSKICAFHLPSMYGIETEDRLLLAEQTDAYGFTIGIQTDASGNSYVALPIDGTASRYYTINLLGIKAGRGCDLTAFNDDVKRLNVASLVQ